MSTEMPEVKVAIGCTKCGYGFCSCNEFEKVYNTFGTVTYDPAKSDVAAMRRNRMDGHIPSSPEVSAPLAITEDTLGRVKSIIATQPVRAAGYRLKVLLIESDKGLSAGEAEIAPTLAKAGLIMKSDNQKSREDRGSDTALIVDVGPAAWCRKDFYGPEPWAKVGMVIKMIRYTGHAYEEPPGSGKRYALINDEDVMGYYEETVHG